MLERFVEQTHFTSQEDFIANFKVKVPENFNFGYDVVDAWAAEQPDKNALLWTNDKGAHIQFTYADLKKYTDMTASYFQSLGIGHGDKVMLILKRRYEFWFSIIALHKLGAVVIPATHLLTKKDIVYRCQAAGIKMIVAAGEPVITEHILAAMPDSPTVERLVSVGPEYPEGFEDFHKGMEAAVPFVRPEHVNTNEDISLMYFTSGTTGEPKMVAHDFTYPLGHIATGCFWHNLHENSLHLTIADTGWGKAVWGKLYGQMIAGANIFVYDHEKFTPADILQKIHDYHITSLCAPPTIYRFLIREDLSKYDLSSLEYCTTAGEAVNYSVYETFKRITGIRLMEGFGQTSYDNLIESLERAKETTLPRVIYSLGIANIGLANAKVICRYFNNDLEKIRHASLEEISEIDTIGPVIAGNLVSYFQDEENNRRLDHLMSFLHIQDEGPKQEQIFAGMNFVITGSLVHFGNRSEAKELIESLGGKVTGSVTKKTNYLINNDIQSSSSKNKKARELGIPILSEEDFLNLVGKQ